MTPCEHGRITPPECLACVVAENEQLRAQIVVKDECLRHLAKKYEGRPLSTEEHGAQN